MTTTQIGLPTSRQPRSGGLRPTLWVLAFIVLLGVVLPIVNTAVGTTYKTDGTPVPIGQGVQLTPRSGWGIDQDNTVSGERVTLIKGATALTVEVEQNAAPLPDLWEDVRGKVAQQAGIDLVTDPNSTATDTGVPGLTAPLSAPRAGGTAAVYSDGKTAAQAIAQGSRYREQAADVAAMLRSLRFGVAEEDGG